MAKYLPLVATIFLFGIISVYSARLPDTEQADDIYTDLTCENSSLDSNGVHQPNLQETRLSRVIRTPLNPESQTSQQIMTGPDQRGAVQNKIEHKKKFTKTQEESWALKAMKERSKVLQTLEERIKALKQQQGQSKHG